MDLKVDPGAGPFYDGGAASPAATAEAMGRGSVVVQTPPAEPPPAPRPPEPKPEPEPKAEATSPAPGSGPGPTAPGAPRPEPGLSVEMRQVTDPRTGKVRWRLLRRIGYVDPDVGPIVVPADLGTWTTDLTSVPPLLTWLVPKTGAHLPAAILHDGLVLDKNEPASYIAPRVVFRDEADRIFRDAMKLTGTGLIRRWLVWAAVAAATMHHGRQVDWAAGERRYYRGVLWGTLGAIVVLGVWAALDLVDVPGVRLPWMGEGPAAEVVGGLSGGIVIPLLLGCLWRDFRIAGWIIGPIAAFVVPAVIPIFLVGVGYLGLERLAAWKPPLARALGVAVVVAAVVAMATFSWRTVSS